MAQTETLTVGGSAMPVYVDAPVASGPHPGVVVTHHRGALDDFTRKFVEDLAAAGYIAAAPLFYHRRPDGEGNDAVDGRAERRGADRRHWRHGGLSAGPRRPSGGRARDRRPLHGRALRVSRRFDQRRVHRLRKSFTAATSSSRGAEGNPAPIERVGGIGCPVIGFFGNEDENPSPEDVAKIDAAMTEHGIDHEFHAYDGAGHAFQELPRPELPGRSVGGRAEEAARLLQADLGARRIARRWRRARRARRDRRRRGSPG